VVWPGCHRDAVCSSCATQLVEGNEQPQAVECADRGHPSRLAVLLLALDKMTRDCGATDINTKVRSGCTLACHMCAALLAVAGVWW
jgi:hypothetical protein